MTQKRTVHDLLLLKNLAMTQMNCLSIAGALGVLTTTYGPWQLMGWDPEPKCMNVLSHSFCILGAPKYWSWMKAFCLSSTLQWWSFLDAFSERREQEAHPLFLYFIPNSPPQEALQKHSYRVADFCTKSSFAEENLLIIENTIYTIENTGHMNITVVESD